MLKRHADEARILMHLFTCTLSVFVPLEIVMKKMLKTRDGSRFSNIRIVNLIIEYRLGYAIIF